MKAVAATLVGADIGAVGASLGPPLRCAAVGEEVHLGYRAVDGSLITDGIVLIDGVVVRTRPTLRSPPSLHGYWVGQPIERLVATFGTPQAMTNEGTLQRLQFAGFDVGVHEGRVVAITPRTLTRAS
ncbi:MAG: hypothetical protein WAT39_09825 [Planctomycetota bacterium]